MSVLPSVIQPTGQKIGSDTDDPLLLAALLKTLSQAEKQQELPTTSATEEILTAKHSDNAQTQQIIDQLLSSIEQKQNLAQAPTASAPATGHDEVLLELRRRLTALPTPQSTTPPTGDHSALRNIVEQFNPNELGILIHELFGKLDLIVENRRLLTTLQDINQFFEEHIADRLAELDDANTKLRQLNHQKDNMLGMVAHDLRGPLGNIKFAVDLLKTLQPTQDEYTHFLQMIEETTANALYLTNDLLDTAAIEAGQLTIDRQIIDLRQLVSRVKYSNSHIGAQKQINLVVELDAALDHVLLDGLRIEQVLGNLLSNAFKYSHAATVVTLKFARNEQDLVISVADQGQGIPPDEIDKLFGLFARASVRPTGHEKSTGLGLAISKRIVELHGGTISVTSTINQGATFTIVLPAAILAPKPVANLGANPGEARRTSMVPTTRGIQRPLNRLSRVRRAAAGRQGTKERGQTLSPAGTATAHWP